MLHIYRKIYELLNARSRRRAALLCVLISGTALFEAAGVASIMPFMAVLADPQVIHTSTFISALYEFTAFDNEQDFLIFLGVCVLLVVVASSALKILTMWTTLRFTLNRGYEISRRLLEIYLNKPYVWYLRHHTADLSKNVLIESQTLTKKILLPAMQLISNALLAVSLILLVLWADPAIGIVAALVFSAAYGAIYWFIRKRIVVAGRDRFVASRERFQATQEAFGGLRELKIGGLENYFVQKFSGPAQRLARRQTSTTLMSMIPGLALEAFAFCALIGITLILLAYYADLSQILPLIALFAFASYRLLPALQKVYACIAQIGAAKPVLDSIHAEFLAAERDGHQAQNPRQSFKRLPLNSRIELKDVSFSFPNTERPVLDRISLVIPANSTIGIVGSSGAGKTTLTDVILGLLNPTGGSISIDDILLTPETLGSWHKTVGYVPQHIFLTDDTVAANIAYGTSEEAIDMAAVEKAAQMAELHGFVSGDLPKGYQTPIGERGVRLSGGQRQRIGIARALYHQPDVLIFDEATSALDNITERAVMHSVRVLSGQKTIILVAHRLTTVQHCDEIFVMEAGRVRARGDYQRLITECEEFRTMATN